MKNKKVHRFLFIFSIQWIICTVSTWVCTRQPHMNVSHKAQWAKTKICIGHRRRLMGANVAVRVPQRHILIISVCSMCSRAVATAAIAAAAADAAGAHFLYYFLLPFFDFSQRTRSKIWLQRFLASSSSSFRAVMVVVAPKSQFDPSVENAREWNKTQWTSECNSVKNRIDMQCVLRVYIGEGAGAVVCALRSVTTIW